ncbi:MAG: GntR family transcriptional regulator [Verrucomicrobiales bacterium]
MTRSKQLRKLPRRRIVTEPVHQQIAGLCRDAIHRRSFVAGDKFPSERELASQYGVSRTTANKAISTLIAENLLELEKGLGTRVVEPTTLFASLREMESFTEHVRNQGMEPVTRVLKLEHLSSTSLPEPVRVGLGIGARTLERVTYLERLRLADNVPLILEHRWVRDALAPGLSRGDVEKSFYHLLEEKYQLPMTGESHSISAVNLDQAQAKLLDTKVEAAALLVEGTGFVRKAKPVWYQRLYYRGDRYELHNETRGSVTPAAFQLRLMERKLSA